MQGIIIKGIGGFYYIKAEDSNVYECKARGIFRKENIKPMIGDMFGQTSSMGAMSPGLDFAFGLTGDSYIEKASHELSKSHRVRVATSDNQEQLIILGNGAVRLSANSFRAELLEVEKEIREFIGNLK